MLKRDEVYGPSCLTRAADDEPLFVLRANDELAPSVVRWWAAAYKEQKTRGGAVIMTEREMEKYHEALALAEMMETWQERVPVVPC